MLLRIAARNILRNTRRSTATLAAITVGVAALILFGAFMGQLILGFQTSTVQRTGHLTLFKSGYFEFGSGEPGAYGIADYRAVIDALRADPVLAPMLHTVTPSVNLLGIAGNAEANTSKNFFGLGVVPSERRSMRMWDEYRVMDDAWRARMARDFGLADDAPQRAVVGSGLARLLGLCAQVAGCRPEDAVQGAAAPAGSARINLLAASATGAPNILSLSVSESAQQAQKEADDSFVAMHLSAAQHLLFGAGEDKVTGIVLQLNRSEDLDAARARLESLIGTRWPGLEVRTFTELTPFYAQAVAMFRAIFGFIAAIIVSIALFIVANTMSMNVIERTDEIGVIRAMGGRRSGVRNLFLAEGGLLGACGATLGLTLALAIGTAFNRAGWTWTPPGQAAPIPLHLLLDGSYALIAGAWLGLALAATLAAVLPANRAARMTVVDALRHV